MLQQALARLLDAFPEPCLRKGLHMATTDAVIRGRLSDGLLHARVKGQQGGLFDVYADLKTWPSLPTRCNCATNNCEHAAASLLALKLKAENPAIYAVPKLDKWLALTQQPPPPPAQILEETTLSWYGEFDELPNQWFAYELGIIVENERINLVPHFLTWLQQYDLTGWEHLPDDHQFTLVVSEKKHVRLSMQRVRPLISFLLYAKSPHGKALHHLKLQRAQWLIFEASLQNLTQSAHKRWLTYPDLLAGLHRLIAQQTLPTIPIPSEFLATLRDYQQQGVDWLQALRVCGLGGVLADDMGLGKTVQTLAHLTIEKKAGRLTRPACIVAPLSLIGNWMAEISRFTPHLRVLVHQGPHRSLAAWESYDIILTTYGLVLRDKEAFLTLQMEYLILDEAQWIKNRHSKITVVVQHLQAIHRLCLSGTPFENHLGELWSIFHFILPGLLGERRPFKTYYQTPIEKAGDTEKRLALMKRIQPFLLRRTKQQVAVELPSKTTMIHHVTLSGTQRDLYETIRMSMEKRVRDAIAKQGLGNSQLLVLDALLKLRQVCCDPRLLTIPLAHTAHGTSAKLDALMTLLTTLMEEGRHVLIFSQFTTMLALIEAQLIARGYAYFKLTGKTKDRQAWIDRFQAGEVPIFLMSLKAGGVGLNLTKADTVIHYDPWWNPATEDQATDRTHRIGQLNPVFVYRLVVTGTVEETMLTIQSRKRHLFEGLLSNHQAGVHSINEDDLSLFFQPIS